MTAFSVHGWWRGATWGVDPTITNPDAESSFATGWTQYIGSTFAVVSGTFDSTENPGLTPHGGSHSFYAGSASVAAAENVVDISGAGAIALTSIDNGLAKAILGAWIATEAAGTDWGGLDMHFLSSSDVWLGGMSYDLVQNSNVWTHYTKTDNIPPSTRKIKIRQRGFRSGGDNKINAYFDDFTINLLGRTDGKQQLTVLSELGDSVTGWSNELNTLITAVTSTSNSSGGAWGTPESALRWGSGSSALGRAYKEVIVGTGSWATFIAAGIVSVVFNWKQINALSLPQSSGRTFIEFVNSSGSVISRTYSDASPVQKGIAGSGDRQMTIAVPAATYRIRFGIEGTRVSGTTLNQIYANFLYLSAFLEK